MSDPTAVNQQRALLHTNSRINEYICMTKGRLKIPQKYHRNNRGTSRESRRKGVPVPVAESPLNHALDALSKQVSRLKMEVPL